MRDVQHRLAALGFDPGDDEAGRFGPGTVAAVKSFQERRGLPVHGTVDPDTWATLVEAGYTLGDRPLYLTQPMLRGDDVADVQRRLSALGFDTGRVDGIFGPRTEQALADFQRNAGIVSDGVCGPATLAALNRLGQSCDASTSVVDVRERERLRAGGRSLAGRTIAIGDTGGVAALAAALARMVRAAGGTALVLQHPDGSEQAALANAGDADVYVGLSIGAGSTCTTAFFRNPRGWESSSGRLLATTAHEQAVATLGAGDGGVRGMVVPVLRETRMPAVLVELAPPEVVVQRTPELADALTVALETWLAAMADERS